MAKFLLTGGSGFIGSHFHNAINADDIINMDLVPPFFETGSPYVKGDIRNVEDVRSTVSGSGIETIISLAAKHHDFGIGHDEYFDTNEDGTRVICKVASDFGIKHIIFFSSVAVYGMRQEVTNELTNPMPDSPYGASKFAGERVLKGWADEDESRSVLIIRPTVVYGSNNVANMFNLIRQIDSGFYFHIGKGHNIKSIAYVENLVKATLFLSEKLKPGFHIYNYADEPQLTSKKIGNIIAEALGKKIRFTFPLPIALFLGLPFDYIIKITGKNFPISTARIRKLNTETYHSATKIFNEGFRPEYSTIDGLKKMVKWYLDRKIER